MKSTIGDVQEDAARLVADPSTRIGEALLDLRGALPFTASLVTVRHSPNGPDQAVNAYRMASAHITHGVTEFIPRSREFQLVVAKPHDILDWTAVPAFRESATARDHLLSAGYTQGVSFVLMQHERIVGSFHLNASHTDEFSNAEFQALDRARNELREAVGAIVESAGLGLSRREIDVLALITAGATNKAIADALDIAQSTVKTHTERIFFKLKASNRTQAAQIALAGGLVPRLPADAWDRRVGQMADTGVVAKQC